MDLSEVEDIVKNILHKRPASRYEIVHFQCGDSLDIEKNTYAWSEPIPYKRWRVVAVGFSVTTSGITTENPEVEFGIEAGDIATADADYFGSVFQDTTGGKHFVAGDAYIKDPYDVMADAKALNGAGTPVWHTGTGKLGTWLENINHLKVTRPNDHILGVMPFMVIEVKN